jgi:hypothetical protein
LNGLIIAIVVLFEGAKITIPMAKGKPGTFAVKKQANSGWNCGKMPFLPPVRPVQAGKEKVPPRTDRERD